ncbi:MAG: hypothetical protein ABW067_06010 [Rhizobacter sp.]|jgi:hypothetical protein
MRGVNIKAITIGALVTAVLILLIAIGFLFWHGSALFAEELSDDESSAVIAALFQRTDVLVVTTLLGAATNTIGAYVTARIARNAPMLNVVVYAALSVAAGVLFFDADLPVWFNVLSFAVIVPAAYAGARLADRKTSVAPAVMPQ